MRKFIFQENKENLLGLQHLHQIIYRKYNTVEGDNND